ncbi:hypothetical protein Kpol_1004p46 [Vanderwaltozyma polyspora DSM 70294]|uniref:Mediator of RNA polymerase II transcription subunit 13 n=1 Tax=Vanderwaltozyma polyspora (strain ATCC 22028 / DSM 70294 / BCRC 21397 / CBS 2163 / NBRC 10782 / NRRL Y-8283 / UCD 57-17) TaxID=436907 RepID=A7TJA2_VANPO|nr:uncharacterized protein Kpol_1004p46 [Vanderwaltozyma polyspora DSM 70294]EDO17671.1 hypothetical protein Kpol_1004p46 [Vanderwaltozyma polyspora DSM 70294]
MNELENCTYNLENVLLSFYKIANVQKINYNQYNSKKNDEQWAIHTELLLRKKNPSSLVASLSKELWCFSLNDDQIPDIPKNNNSNEIIHPDKSGNFNSNYSKPNLPPHYAIFLKALRRMIYINLTKSSINKLYPFGNGSIFMDSKNSTCIFQVEPHLFENGDLTISLSLKNLNIVQLNLNNLDDSFLKNNAIYLLPLGTRAYLPSSNISACIAQPPENSDALLNTLLISHGIDLISKKNLQWVKLIPHLGHFNGHIPRISSYIDTPKDSRSVIWPIDLIFVQPALQVDKKKPSSPKRDIDDLNFNLDDALDIVDNFIQLRQSSAYRTPGSSGILTGTNPLSSGGAYTDQFQNFQRNMAISSNGSTQSYKQKITPSDSNINYTMEKRNANSVEQFGMSELITSDLDHLNDKRNYNPDLLGSPLKSESNRRILNFDNQIRSTERTPNLSKESSQLENESNNSAADKELFGEEEEEQEVVAGAEEEEDGEEVEEEEEEEEEDLFGESNNSSEEKSRNKRESSDEITEDMFGLSDDEDATKSNTNLSDQNFFRHSENENIINVAKPNNKRKYLDIPLDEITLSNTPLYTDPGAPLPVETPRDRRKSVFAPLNFNPIIEHTVDNKYKNGGKFSFSPSHNEEALNFDISKNGLSTSEDDDSDFSDDLEGLEVKPIERGTDNNGTDSQFLEQNSLQVLSEPLPPSLLRGELLSGNDNNNIDVMKENLNSIWKINQNGMNTNDSPIRAIEASYGPMDVDSKSSSDIFPKMPITRDQPLSANRSPDLAHVDIIETNFEPKGTELQPANFEFSSNPLSSLPFLLRHMPLSTIPEVFLSSTPSLTISDDNQRVLNLLSEQLVYDFDTLQGLNIPSRSYKGITSCTNGLITNVISNLFPNFDRINGSDIISQFYPMREPYVYVKKHHDIIKIRADSQPFSKYLNLKPSKGIKNFRFLLITTSSKENCSTFVSTLCQTYIGYEFGFCELLKLNNEDTQGMIYLQDYEDNKLLLLAAQIVSYCSTNKSSGKEVPLLLVLPLKTNRLSDLVEMTSKFEIINNEVKSKIPNAQIFFKAILMDFINNPLVSIDEYFNQCVSIYNILPQKSIKFASIAPKHPEKIKFRTLQSSGGPSVIHYDSYIHLAYSRSLDKQWVFAAFSDSNGNDNLTRAWYVGSSKNKFDETCNEIWYIALKLASKKYGKICLILTRLNSVLPDDELMNWRRLSGRNVHLAVVCVDDTEKISFYDQDENYPSFKKFFKNENYTNALQKEDLEEYEIRDIDYEVHGIIFKSPFPLSNSQHRCAIKSGALMKFHEAAGEALWDKFEVNLLNCPHSDSTQLLKTILEEYRNLAALSTWFGVSNGDSAQIPWHVLAVKKMMKCLVHLQVSNK